MIGWIVDLEQPDLSATDSISGLLGEVPGPGQGRGAGQDQQALIAPLALRLIQQPQHRAPIRPIPGAMMGGGTSAPIGPGQQGGHGAICITLVRTSPMNRVHYAPDIRII